MAGWESVILEASTPLRIKMIHHMIKVISLKSFKLICGYNFL